MIYHNKRRFKIKKVEPVLRSCWECNPSHEYLKDIDIVHYCPQCGRLWIHGRFFDCLGSDEKFDSSFEKKELKKGESTKKSQTKSRRNEV